MVDLPSEYAMQVLNKNHTGLISIKHIAKDPLLGFYLVQPSLLDNNTKVITNNLVEKFGTTGHVSIQKQISLNLVYAWLESHPGFTYLYHYSYIDVRTKCKYKFLQY